MPASASTIGGLLAPAASLGRYFSVVGGMTTLLASAIPIALVGAGAPTQRPTVHRAVNALGDVGLQEVAALGLLVLVAGLMLHPLQFPFTQLLEGYWGTSRPATRAMTRSIQAHLDRHFRLQRTSSSARKDLRERLTELTEAQKDTASKEVRERLDARRQELQREAASLTSVVQAADAALRTYPEAVHEMMPTKLGNILRRHERLAGAAFGLDAVTATPFLLQVASDDVKSYVDDTRTDMDVAVRMVLVWTVATVVTAAMLWRYDLWLLVPLATFLCSWTAYRGAVFAAVDYGTALQVLTALTRRQLYEALGMDFPPDSGEEFRTNEDLSIVLQGVYKTIPYRQLPLE